MAKIAENLTWRRIIDQLTGPYQRGTTRPPGNFPAMSPQKSANSSVAVSPCSMFSGLDASAGRLSLLAGYRRLYPFALSGYGSHVSVAWAHATYRIVLSVSRIGVTIMRNVEIGSTGGAACIRHSSGKRLKIMAARGR